MGEGALRALKVAVVVMGVLIVGGAALLGVLIARRMSGVHTEAASATLPNTAPVSAMLDEPPGTRIASASLAGRRLTLALHGAGPDRVVVVDLANGRILARVALPR